MSSIQTDGSPSGDDLSRSGQRILAIDALRGFDMFWIVGGRTLAMWLTRVFADPVPDGVRHHLGHPA